MSTVTELLRAFNTDTLLSTMHLSRVEAMLQAKWIYPRPPTIEADQVVAMVDTVRSIPDLWVMQPRGVVRLGLVRDRQKLHIGASCNCSSWNTGCAHVSMLVADLCASPALREAVALGHDLGPALEGLPAARQALLDELRVMAVVSKWMPVATRQSSVPHELGVMLLAPDVGGWGGDPVKSTPGLLLRFRPMGSKTVYLPDAGLPSLPPDDLRLVELGRVAKGSRKGIELRGTSIARVLSDLESTRRPFFLEPSDGRAKRVECGVGAPLGLRFEFDSVTVAQLPFDASRMRRPSDALDRVDALVARWTRGDEAFGVAGSTLFTGAKGYVFLPATERFHPLDASVDPDVAANAMTHWAVELRPTQRRRFYEVATKVLMGRATLPPPEDFGLPPRETPAFVVRVEGSPLALCVRLESAYPSLGTLPITPGARSPSAEAMVRRDMDAEREALRLVEARGFPWNPDLECWAAEDEKAVEFWRRDLPALRASEAPKFTFLMASGLERIALRPAALRATLRVSLVGNLLEAEVGFGADITAEDIARARAALHNKRRWVVLTDGTIAELGAEAGSLLDEADELGAKVDTKGDATLKVRLGAHQLGRVERWASEGVITTIDPAVELYRERLRALAVRAEPEAPKKLNAELRPYQKQGVAWLQFLAELGVGGILADDMGLGKTLTALALLAWRKDRDGRTPSLVVCPTSVAGNWVREAAKFTPGLRVGLVHGADRVRKPEAFAKLDIAVTTYGLLRRDIETLKKVAFRYVIFDEAQQVKNAGAVTAQAARELVADARLALTGTPVENRLSELWSIMDLCNPGMLGTLRSFQERYERPVVRDASGEEAAKLRALVRPFVLRRTKREVLQDLPPKEEIELGCVLDALQRRTYDAVAALVRKEVEDRIATEGQARSGLLVLTALLRLRQVCCDPRLLDGAIAAKHSTKREVFLGLIEELVAEGRRALVFSQFVELLTLWRKDLDAMGVRYEYLDGSTRDRDAAVDRFQTGNAPLFLISLKAGGTGLNLTAADTVIHCDPWWNPAVEDQATDRAHRIGQTEKVTVYRLVAKGTVEEKIMLLQKRKRALADAVISEHAGALQGLSSDDVAALLGNAGSDD